MLVARSSGSTEQMQFRVAVVAVAALGACLAGMMDETTFPLVHGEAMTKTKSGGLELTETQRQLLEMACESSGLTPERVLEEISTALDKHRNSSSWRDCLSGPLGDVWTNLPLEAQLVAFDFACSLDGQARSFDPHEGY